jgi:ribosomal protein S10
MKQYYLQIKSKNEKSLQHFLQFFFKHLTTKFKIFSTAISNQNNIKIITLLKSPHVNKIAQEHFGFSIYLKNLLLQSFDLKTNSIALKKILNSLFQDVSINLKFIAQKTIEEKNNIIVFYLDNFKGFKINAIKYNKKRAAQKRIIKILSKPSYSHNILSKFLNLTSIFGEILIFHSKKNIIV